MLFVDKAALITGAGRGIGKAIALSFAQEGCNVILASRSLDELSSVAREAEAMGVHALAIPCDVANPSDIQHAAQTAINAFGAVDILVNNAGYASFKPVWEVTLDDWERSIAVNATSAFLFTQSLLPSMMARRSGRIINMSSVTGLKALPEQGAYCAAKHALNGWTKSLAHELRDYGIAVHAVCPGGVDTQFSREAMPHRDKTNWMTPEDIAHTVVYLASLSPRVAVDFVSLRRFAGDPLV